MTSCRVSIDELRHDEDEMSRTALFEEAQKDAEWNIGNLDEVEDIIFSLNHMSDAVAIDLLKKIRERDLSVLGLLPILKTYFADRAMEDRK